MTLGQIRWSGVSSRQSSPKTAPVSGGAPWGRVTAVDLAFLNLTGSINASVDDLDQLVRTLGLKAVQPNRIPVVGPITT